MPNHASARSQKSHKLYGTRMFVSYCEDGKITVITPCTVIDASLMVVTLLGHESFIN